MASPPIAERTDIHKSCKAIEGVVNLLNDYCDAATAIVAIQKKLAKAVRDAAAIKCTSEIAVNALGTCAAVVEALVDVDSKFVRIADKECELLSSDVKKWFKALAKEERAHDAKLTAANNKIKQAGQQYEKKVKKNPANAAEEHARYINTLGTLGPEVSQEKYQHALSVFQQHTTLILSMAVSVCRLVDAEWLRACEQVRRVAPGVGRVGEWRTLCEGGWTGPVPGDLPDVDERIDGSAAGRALKVKMSMNDVKPSSAEDALSTPHAATPAPEYASRATTPAAYSPSQPPTYFSPKDPPAEISQQSSDKEDMRDRSQSVNSIASLGSFPTPPTHFPIPPVPSSSTVIPGANGSSTEQPTQQDLSLSARTENHGRESLASPATRFRSDSSNTNFLDFNSPQSSPMMTTPRDNVTRLEEPTTPATEMRDKEPQMYPSSGAQQDKTASSASAASSSSTSSVIRSSQIYKRGDYIDNGEFGVRKPVKASAIPEEPVRTASPQSMAGIDRRDSSSSSVSVMRERLTRSTAPASPPPRDVPRLPLSVSNLATRYEAVAETQDPRREPKSPTEERRMSVDARPSQGRVSPATPRNVMASPQSMSSYATAMSGPTDEDILRRRQRIRELEELELREQEHELRVKERDMEQRARELERDRQRLISVRTYRGDSPAQAQQNASQPSTKHADPSSSSPVTSRHPFPSSVSQPRPQVAPAPSMGQRFPSSQSTSSQPSSPSLYHPSHEYLNHPDTCGCEACSIAKYNTKPSTSMNPMASTTSLRPPDSPVLAGSRTEKPKGWIRRLSMPVMANAFSSDSKKGISSANYMSGGGAPYRNSLVSPDEDGRVRAMMGDPKNRSVTNLVGRR